MPEESLHQILGVGPDASQAEIRAAYIKQAKQWHPDLNHGNELKAGERFKIITSAYESLSDKKSNTRSSRRYQSRSSHNSNGNANGGTESIDPFKQYMELIFTIACALADLGSSEIEIRDNLIQSGLSEEIAREVSKRAFRLKGRQKPEFSNPDKDEPNTVNDKNGAHNKTKTDHGNGAARRENGPKRSANKASSYKQNTETELNYGQTKNINESNITMHGITAILKKMFTTIIFEIAFVIILLYLFPNNFWKIVLLLWAVKFIYYKFLSK